MHQPSGGCRSVTAAIVSRERRFARFGQSDGLGIDYDWPFILQKVGGGATLRVLAVEDDPGVAALVRRALEGEGFKVDLAANGTDGLWKATEQQYDAIVLDILLPDMNGYLICRELRSAGVTTPIMMLTAKKGDLDQAEGLDLGADDYMTKPFSVIVFLARLRALIRRGPAVLPPVLEFDELSLDPSTRVCLRAGEEIQLTPREFALLRYLMTRPGSLVSSGELLRQVWNDEIEDSDVVRVYIGYLRRKVDGPFSKKLIQTVHGHGYRLEAGSSARRGG